VTVRDSIFRGWQNLRAMGVKRLLLTLSLLVAALFLARFSWTLPILGEAETALYDMRVLASAPSVEQDQRILMVPYTDETLIASRKRSPLDRALLARALTALDGMGAKAIGVDILIDQPQDEDAELLATLQRLKTPLFLAFADVNTNADNIVYAQQAFLKEFTDQLQGSNAAPASVRLTTDSDGTARAWPVAPPGLPPLLSRAMLEAAGGPEKAAADRFTDYHGAIAYRRPQVEDRPVFASLPIDLFADPEIAPALAEQVRGRFVLIGGDIVDTDQFETPFSRFEGRTIPGLHVHGHMLAQMLDGARPAAWSNVLLWGVSALIILAAILTGFSEARWVLAAPLILVQLGLFSAIPFLAHMNGTDTIGMPAFGWWTGWLLAFLGSASAARAIGAEQRRFAQSALGKYLPRDIARQIIARPELLALHGERREIFAVFSDLEGFTKLSHAVEPEVVASLLNRYLDDLSAVVLRHGGVIDKFVGDAVVAFWGAPISRPDDGENAARAAYAMWEAGEAFRRSAPSGVPPIGKTRVGLHYGEAIVGNFGGEGRIQYTALGDSMNTAARLESANKALGSSVIASREAAERTGLDWWRPLGSVLLRGRSTPVDVFEPAPQMAAEDRARLGDLIKLARTDRAAAIAGVETLLAAAPDDEALAKLLNRMKSATSKEAYEIA
jgi:adenylate cyclase